MDSGGTIVISVSNVEIDVAKANVVSPKVAPGNYLRLAVADSGCGMDETMIENLFSPFFTSRETGSGSGLGLNIVHRIVESHNGGIEVRSNTGDGTTFYIYLPVVAEPVAV